MRADELTVEVRDRDLNRVGIILTRDLDLTAKVVWSGVGEWTLTLPENHPMVEHLMEPGSGVVVTGPVGQVHHAPVFSPWSEAARNLAPAIVGDGTWAEVARWNTGDPVPVVVQPEDFRVRDLGTGESVMEIERVRGLAAVNCVAGVSTRNGKPAARFISTGSTNSYADFVMPALARAGGTFQGTLHLDAPQTGTLKTEARELVANSPWTRSAKPPNTAGEHVVKLVYGALTSSYRAYIFHGGSLGSGDVWWTDIGLFAGVYDGPWFGVDTPGDELTRYVQDGTAVVKQTRTLVTPAYTEILTGTVFSGPRVPTVRVRDQKNPDGTLTFKGVTDEILLDDTLAYPSPGVVDPNAQTVANDVRTGTTESLMRQYVSYNMGPLAPAGRRRGFRSKVVLAGSDLGRGVTTSRSPRFQNLLELLQGLATEGTLGFRLVQVGAQLQFQIVPVRDLRATVRLDLNNGTILSEESQDQGPTLTYAIVAGKGEGTERTMVVRTRSTQTTEESQWGRPIERFYDRRDTDNLLELQAKGDEELSLTGEGVAVKLMPSDDQTMRYLIDWNVGDWVTAVVNGQETWSVATEAVVRATSKFAGVGMSIGDVTSFTPESRAQAQANKNDSRIGYLERAAAGPIENDRLPGRLQEVGQQVTDWNHAVASGFYWSGSSSANAPTGFATLAFMGEVIQNSGGNLVQILRALNFADDRLKRVWTRVRFSGAWQPWVLDDPTPPSLIAFQAKMSIAAYNHSGASYWNRIPFPVEVLDKGSCYDPVQSRFTAPVAGVYDFDFSVTPSGGSSGPSFAWRKNGGTISDNQADVVGYFTNYATVGGNRIMELAAGDYVEVWVLNANNSTVVLQGAYGGFFSGKILR